MKRTSSIIWIFFLLAALVLGPAVILRRPTVLSAQTGLRETIAQEKLVDAPHNTPTKDDDSADLDPR